MNTTITIDSASVHTQWSTFSLQTTTCHTHPFTLMHLLTNVTLLAPTGTHPVECFLTANVHSSLTLPAMYSEPCSPSQVSALRSTLLFSLFNSILHADASNQSTWRVHPAGPPACQRRFSSMLHVRYCPALHSLSLDRLHAVCATLLHTLHHECMSAALCDTTSRYSVITCVVGSQIACWRELECAHAGAGVSCAHVSFSPLHW
jgi:hypothetical protein